MKHPSYGALHTYIHTDRQTDRQSDMGFFFLRMRLLASPFGLAISFALRARNDCVCKWARRTNTLGSADKNVSLGKKNSILYQYLSSWGFLLVFPKFPNPCRWRVGNERRGSKVMCTGILTLQ
jgi:hypothetical protein